MKKNICKQAGIFMDHRVAFIREPFSIGGKTIKSLHQSHMRFEGETSDEVNLGNFRSTNNESHKHHREQNDTHQFFKMLSDELNSYDEVLILGATTAPSEFLNYCNAKKLLKDTKLKVEKSDYISDNQFLHKVNTFFNPN